MDEKMRGTVFEHAVCCSQENAWMTVELFERYMRDVFEPATRPLRKPRTPYPVVLLCDNHGSHWGLEMLDFCAQNDIMVLSFTPKSTHICQPLDDVPIRAFRAAIGKAISLWRLDHRGNVQPEDLVEIMATPLAILADESTGAAMSPWGRAFCPRTVKKAFYNIGIYPIDKTQVLDAFRTKGVPSSILAAQAHASSAVVQEVCNILVPPGINATEGNHAGGAAGGGAVLLTSAQTREELRAKKLEQDKRAEELDARRRSIETRRTDREAEQAQRQHEKDTLKAYESAYSAIPANALLTFLQARVQMDSKGTGGASVTGALYRQEASLRSRNLRRAQRAHAVTQAGDNVAGEENRAPQWADSQARGEGGEAGGSSIHDNEEEEELQWEAWEDPSLWQGLDDHLDDQAGWEE